MLKDFVNTDIRKRTKKFQSFYGSIFDNRIPQWKDGPDITSLLSLDEEEKKLAEKVLLDNITQNDPFIFECFGVLKSKDAQGYLSKVLEKKIDKNVLLSCSLALWQINHNIKAVRVIINILKSENKFLRINTLSVLARIDTNEAKECIFNTLNDKSDLVRYNALRYLSIPLPDSDIAREMVKLTSNKSYLKREKYFDNIKAFLDKYNES